MTRRWIRQLAALTAVGFVPVVTTAQHPRADVAAVVDANRERAEQAALQLWDYAESDIRKSRSDPPREWQAPRGRARAHYNEEPGE